MRSFAALAAALVLAGCITSTMGRRIEYSVLRSMRIGETTRAQALAALGQPFTRIPDSGAGEVWMYMHSKSRSTVHPASFVVPFYTHVDSDTQTETATLTFQGELLAKMDWIDPGPEAEAGPAATPAKKPAGPIAPGGSRGMGSF